FVLLILSFFVIPHIPFFRMPNWGDVTAHFWPSFFLYLFFLPNLQLLLFGAVPYSGQAWSIGVEEQYYLFWPLVVNKCSNVEKLKKTTLVLIAVYLSIKVFLILSPRFFPHNSFLLLALHFFKGRFQIDCLLIGSYFACINDQGRIKLLFNKYVQLITYIAALVMMIGAYDVKNFFWEINAVLYSIIIINLVNYKTSIINLDYKILNYIGKISYGMYMYHFIFITLVMRMVSTNSIIMYFLVFALTIGVSALSYELFEKRLLKLKERFARIKTEPAR
ncbi:MAG: acyltransferase family protein, partial [Flavipsychrobacter sp.]